MAIATYAADIDTGGGALQLDSIPIVDLRLFSQSEIYALSISSSSAFDPDRCDDVVIPKIDRSVFNESAGSRKQTYSRLRLAPPTSFSAAGRRRAPHLRRTVVNTGTNTPDLENGENAQMLALFKKLFASEINLGDSFPVKIDHENSLPTLPLAVVSEADPDPAEGSRGNKRKYDQTVVDIKDNVDGISSLNDDVVRENLEGKDGGIMNVDGVVVDFSMLGLIDHPYLEEIGRMTEGLSTVEELVEFLGGFKGRWDSSRKKRRTVDASAFGRVLPTGWKLLIAIQKKKEDDRAWLCCTRYISPSGQQFMSCKEASSYLLNLTGAQDTNPSTSLQHNETVSERLTSIGVTDIDTDVDKKEYPSSDTPVPVLASTVSNQEMQVTSDAQFLSDEGLNEILQCNKCNLTFCKKDESLHYRSSVHKRNENKNTAPKTWIKGNKGLNDSPISHVENTHVINSATEGSVSIKKNPEQNALPESCFIEKQLTADIVNNKSNPLLAGEYTVGEIQFGTAPVIPSSIENDIVPVKNDSEAVEFEKEKGEFEKEIGEQERPFTVDCGEPANGFNIPDQGMDPNVPRGDNELSSDQDFMFDFGEMNAQSADENLFEGCFDVVPNPNVRTFDLISEKVEEGLFEADKGINSCTYVLGSGRTEPVENSFMGEQGSNSLAEGELKKLSHEPMFEQELWLGTDDLMANNDDTNDGTSVCVWCRNLFFQDHVQTQTGAIGSLCPSCSTR